MARLPTHGSVPCLHRRDLLKLGAAAGTLFIANPMGETLNHRRGPIRFEIDVSRGPAWRGKTLSIQILTPGNLFPRILTSQSFTVPETEDETVKVTVDINADEARWVLVRLSDPTRPADRRATGPYASLGGAVVYSSPFWLDPA